MALSLSVGLTRARFTPVSLTPVRSTPVRSARLRSAPVRSAPAKSTPDIRASVRFVFIRIASCSRAPVRTAPVRSARSRRARFRFAEDRSAPDKFAPARFVRDISRRTNETRDKFRPERSWPLRSRRCRTAHRWAAFRPRLNCSCVAEEGCGSSGRGSSFWLAWRRLVRQAAAAATQAPSEENSELMAVMSVEESPIAEPAVTTHISTAAAQRAAR
ncbi:nlpC/P60 family protein [Actinomadura verrucosospora]|uniref:NlpC/P60 family protein n=1 Tax=Actinomadura verrucosospora TaxID=46165 RepID=A0A7D3ZI07_ACTVE|nr:nlpC/P60 family protein [Actinomadura verrucosospora]